MTYPHLLPDLSCLLVSCLAMVLVHAMEVDLEASDQEDRYTYCQIRLARLSHAWPSFWPLINAHVG